MRLCFTWRVARRHRLGIAPWEPLAYPREQLVEPERLRHEVEGADVQRRHDVAHLGSAGQHDDRYSDAMRAHVLEDLDALALRERHVEHEEVEAAAERQLRR